jgi:Outer membrane protein beta-barrel domain
MNFNKNTAFLSFVLMLVMSAGAQAGNQGIHFFYGVGVTGVSSAEKVKTPELDAAGGGEFMIGLEEDGWALEYSGIRTLESGTNTTNLDYTASITQLSLAYRTIEKGKMYYKIKAGQMTADLDFTGNTAAAETEGNFVGLGLGMRTKKDARIELEYSLYSSDDIDTTHMFTLRYLFGGAPFDGSF